MWSAIRSCSGSSGPTNRTAPKIWPGSSRCNSDKMGLSPKNFAVVNHQRRHAINNGKLCNFLKSLIPELGISRREFSVVFITDERIRELNREYRGYDKPTDVLSFRGDGEYLG